MDLFFTVDSDEEWSKAVAKHYGGHCAWAGCSSKWGLGAHHVVRRGHEDLRRLVANGVLLCTEHHGLVEEVKGRPIYDRLMKLLVGPKRYARLQQLLAESLEKHGQREEIEMPSSDIDL